MTHSAMHSTHGPAAVGVVKTVGVAISMLTKLNDLVPVLKDLGKRHTKYVRQPETACVPNCLPSPAPSFCQRHPDGSCSPVSQGVVAAHYPIVGGAFLKTLSVGLGPAYTPEVAACFTAMWGVVESTMLSEA